MADEATTSTDTPAPAAEAAPSPSPLAGSPLGTQEEAPVAETPAPEGESSEAAPSGEDSVAASEGSDSLTAASYDFILPEGVSVDEASMTTLKETLAKSQVPPEVGQSLIDLHIAELNRSAEAFAAQQTEAWTSTLDEWKAAINADPELGGSKKATVTASIANAFDLYGTPEARQAFDVTGAGWNPHIIKFIHKMALALSEGTHVPSNGPSAKRGSTPAAVLYPDSEQGNT